MGEKRNLYPSERGVACKRCGAPAGSQCQTKTGRLASLPHEIRGVSWYNLRHAMDDVRTNDGSE
jgi:hypothetical protein